MAPENTIDLGARAAELIEHAADWSETIDRIRHEYVFNLGHADEAGGEYLLQGILARQAAREGAEGKEARHA